MHHCYKAGSVVLQTSLTHGERTRLNSPRFEAKQGGSHLLLGLLFSQLPCPLLGRERRGKHSEKQCHGLARASPPAALTATRDQAEKPPERG